MLYLNGNEIMQAITLDEVMKAVADAYILFDKGRRCSCKMDAQSICKIRHP